MHPASRLLRRRPTAPVPTKPVLPKRVRPRTSAFPLLPALAALMILMSAAQLGLWWWEARLPGIPGTVPVRANPFVALHATAATPDGSRVRPARQLNAPALPQNVQFGDAMGRVTVTIFSDPSCGSCRKQVQAWTAGLPVEGVRQVYKFWPQDQTRLTPGLLVELARREGRLPAFWRSMQGAGGSDLDDGSLLGMLERAGVPLSTQRGTLARDGASLTQALEADIALAKDARLPAPPVMMVDNYVLDGATLSPLNLGLYVRKRLEGRQLFEKDDLWLMRK